MELFCADRYKTPSAGMHRLLKRISAHQVILMSMSDRDMFQSHEVRTYVPQKCGTRVFAKSLCAYRHKEKS